MGGKGARARNTPRSIPLSAVFASTRIRAIPVPGARETGPGPAPPGGPPSERRGNPPKMVADYRQFDRDPELPGAPHEGFQEEAPIG